MIEISLSYQEIWDVLKYVLVFGAGAVVGLGFLYLAICGAIGRGLGW